MKTIHQLMTKANKQSSKGLYDKALKTYMKTLKIYPNNADINYNISLILLKIGNYQEGWKLHEASRWDTSIKQNYQINIHKPKLQNLKDAKYKTILIYPEQGFGDMIQFVRYAKLLVKSGAKVLLGVTQPLKRLFSNIKDTEIFESNDNKNFDFFIPYMSLPALFKTNIETIPSFKVSRPYIKVDNKIFNTFTVNNKYLNIGLVTKGNPEHTNDKNRSIDIEAFDEILNIKGVRFYSLEIDNKKLSKYNIVNCSQYIDDFMDTAFIISKLDLVITVDSSIAHLTGAMGKKVWILLPFDPDFRWLLGTNKTSWYPTAKLFRADKKRGWHYVLKKISKNIEKLF